MSYVSKTADSKEFQVLNVYPNKVTVSLKYTAAHSMFFRSATWISFLWERISYGCCASFCLHAMSLSCKQYVKPRPWEVCSWAIYHRHPGFPLCLITPGSTKRQSASGPAAGVGGGHCVFALALTGHIFPSTFNDGTAYRMPFLFKKVKESD